MKIKQSFSKKRVELFSILILGLAMLVSFQNCSLKSFESVQTAANSSQNVDRGPSSDDGNEDNNPDDGSVIKKSCNFQGQTLQDGGSSVGYSASTVPNGQLCSSVQVSVRCNDGVLNPSNAMLACSVAPPNTTPNPPSGGGSTTTNFCPSYATAPIYRARSRTITVGPNDAWANTIQNNTDVEILLKDGTYFSEGDIVLGNNVTVRSESRDKDKVIIYGRGYYNGDQELFRVHGRNVTIADISVTQARNHLISIKSEMGAQAPHIYNVHLYDSGEQQIKGSSSSSQVQNGLIACSRIGYGNGGNETRTFNGRSYTYTKGVKGSYINGIDLHGPVNLVIRDNYIYNIFGDGSGCDVDVDCGAYIGGGGPAILIWNNASGTITERNIIANSFSGIAYGLGRNHSNGIIRNNFIYNTRTGDAGIQLQTSTNDQVYNNTILITGYQGAIEFRNSTGGKIYNNLISATPWDRGSNSGFVLRNNINNATVNDITAQNNPHLKAGSRAISAGFSIAEVTTDIDGDARTGSNDVGADQYNP